MDEDAQPDEYDSPWKIVLQQFFPQFLAFFFPAAYNDIDWSRQPRFLDQELQEVVRDAELGRRLADKLAMVWLKTGDEAWVLAHVEVQGQQQEEFPERLYVYSYRIYDRYRRRVATLAILADETKRWRPDHFGYNIWGCEVSLRFPVVKLLDYERRWDELEVSDNPFAVVLMAHLRAQSTRRDPSERSRWKLRLVRLLYERGWSREDVLELFRFIDWVMALPREMEQSFRTALHELQEEKKMPYVTSIERLAREEGIEQGIEQGIRESVLDTLEDRFGPDALRLSVLMQKIDGAERLRTIGRLARSAASLQEFRRVLEGF